MAERVNPFIVLDYETGGLIAAKNAITEIAMIGVSGETLQEVGRYESYVYPYLYEYDQKALDYTGITMDKLYDKGKDLKTVVVEMAEKFDEWYKKTSNSRYKKPILVGHNITFDIGFIQQTFKDCKIDLSKYIAGEKDFFGNFFPTFIDTIHISKLALGHDDTMTSYKLTNCCMKMGVDLTDAHKAMNDVEATKELLIKYVNKLRSVGGDESVNKIRLRDHHHFQY